MSTYKVIQDIEAEDKILGPLTLRQFLFALGAAFFLYLCFIVITKHATFLLAVFLPPALLLSFLAFPFGKDQPTEVWAAAKFQFLFRPRRRIWDQSGAKELVTITVPKKIERVYTDGLSQTEVRSRLHALADTIDTRGWAVKNVGVGTYSQTLGQSSDRLVAVSAIPQAVPDISDSEDPLDDTNSSVAQHFSQMITASEQAHRQQLMQQMNQPSQDIALPAPQVMATAPTAAAGANGMIQPVFTAAPASMTPPAAPIAAQPAPADPSTAMWFTQQQPAATAPASYIEQAEVALPPVAIDTTPTPEEEALLEHLKAVNASQQVSNAHMRTLQPISADLGAQPAPVITAPPAAAPVAPAPVTPQPNAAILNLANNNDLNIATLAREANKSMSTSGSDGEVVISLH
ncbi:MAG: uncharacterized protein JWN38_688 [Candidatus Saccharibacteria bacterium]|nr:uncharacterized protein [Candidatus Saccharibacteria bacterium]